jgi:rubrerythrin
MMQAHEIIFNLNKALQMEYSDVFLYPREAKIIEEKDKTTASLFEEFGLMEIRHADLLSRRIIELGGKPVWDFYLLENKTEFKDIINRHIDYETRAIDFYGRLLERVDDETKILLGGIREEEERHLNKLNEIARIIK